MELMELRGMFGMARLRYPPPVEERGFIGNSDFAVQNGEIRKDRMIYLGAFHKAIWPVLESHVSKDASPVSEIGCGTGSFSMELAPEWLSSRLISLDLNEAALKILADSGSTGSLMRASGYRLPFMAEHFNSIVAYSSFDSMIHLPKAMHEAKRVLKPGGKLITFQDLVTDLYDFEQEYGSGKSVEDYHQLLICEAERAGLQVLEGREDYLDVIHVEKIADIKKRIPDFDLDEMPFPLLTIWDRGYVKPARMRANDSRQPQITKQAIMEDFTQGIPRMQAEGLFKGINAGAGDLISNLRMRYLVLQKPE